MNKGQLIEAVAARLGMTQNEARETVDAVLDEICKTIVSREKVTLTGLGVFSVVNEAARAARNPKTGARLEIPARDVVKFKPGIGLTEHVRGLRQPAEDGSIVRKLPRS